MRKVRIVTDGSAHFLNPEIVEQHAIEIVPLEIRVGSRVVHEDLDLDIQDFYDLESSSKSPATLTAPGVEVFERVFQRLNKETDQILALLMSRQMSKTWDNALAASRSLLGRCEIVPIDTMTTSVGLAILAEQAAIAADAGASLEDIIHIVRANLTHVYAAFFVDSLHYLRHNGLLSESQSILGTMLDIKPFLTIEDGELIPMEKVRTHTQALDKLVEFVAEFTDLEQLIILHNAPYSTAHIHMLRDRLATEFPGYEFPLARYRPSLATMIGMDGLGVVVYEGTDDESNLP